MSSIVARAGGQCTFSHYLVEEGNRFPIPRYRQLDEHSCGFLAALAVIRYFDPRASSDNILEAVSPCEEDGCSQEQLIDALSTFGIEAQYVEGLEREDIAALLESGSAVIVTVQPEEWESDHWAAIRGLEGDRVYLSNPAPEGCEYDGIDEDGSLSWSRFVEVWAPQGGALICKSRAGSLQR